MTIFKYKREQLNYHRPPLRDLFAGGGFTSSSGGFETALLDDRPPALGGGGVGDFDFGFTLFDTAAASASSASLFFFSALVEDLALPFRRLL